MRDSEGLVPLSNVQDVLATITANLAQQEGERALTGVLVIGVNDFRTINIPYGYEFGNLLMEAVLARLREGLPARDSIFRLGQGEFVVLLASLPVAESLLRAIDKVKSILFPPFSAGRTRLRVKATLGATVSASRRVSAEELLQEADQALLDARLGHQESAIHEMSKPLGNSDDLAIQMHLEYALERSELHLVYQPKVDFRTRRVIGVEALSRWQNSELGFVPPDKFIVIAERSGMISKLTEWVIKSAVKQYRDWGDHAVPIAVNLSHGVLGDPHLVDIIRSSLSIWGMPKEALCLEVTETAVMENPEACLGALSALRDFGVNLSIDDFGTGYSSLAYLKKLPVKELKIDKSFIDNILTDTGDQKIVSAVLSLARSLGLKTVVEGVETEPVYNYMAKLGCNVAQGYYISRPLKPDDYVRWIDSNEDGWSI